MGIVELILTLAITYFGGAVTERETNGALTVNIGYSDSNMSECSKIKH